MAEPTRPGADPAAMVMDLIAQQTAMVAKLFGGMVPAGTDGVGAATASDAGWAAATERLQALSQQFQSALGGAAAGDDGKPRLPGPFGDPFWMFGAMEGWYRQMPLADPEVQKDMWGQGLALWETVLSQYGIGPQAGQTGQVGAALPRADVRFAHPKWSDQPVFALIHQTYLLLAEQATAMADKVEGIDPAKKEQLRFATRALVDAFSPANFPLTNPQVLERAIETKGQSLVKGMEHLIQDLRRGQLTHTDPQAFRVGENIAVTPGQVVHETPLYQLIQYSPTTDTVLAVPLIVFPPWINRFYILDLNPKKSFVRWAVGQGLTVFMVSWKSADATMADVVWDDYIAAQGDAIDVVCQRLDVPSVHAIGYCVAGTTLAATLAVLARQGDAAKVKSATFFTAQVDFEYAGELKHFIDDQQIDTIGHLSPEGFLDGRYMAMSFNLLRGNDLIWSYVVKNYLLGEEYTAFDLLHWNGDVTNLPVKWHQDYLRDLYRDNRLIQPDALSAGGVPIDLRLIATPCYIQAGREDHIAPPESVWQLTRHLAGPWTFVLAGSGHIAGVVNHPDANKYQYWTNDARPDTLDAFVAGAGEHPGSWWPHWRGWLAELDQAQVGATGKRLPGSAGDVVIEAAPGRYVLTR